MRRSFLRFIGTAVAASSLAVLAALPAGAASAAKSARSGTASYVVTFRPGASASLEASESRGKGLKVSHVFEHALKGMSVELTPAEAASLAADPMVATVEPDIVIHMTADQIGATWGLDRIDQRSLPLNLVYSSPDSGGAGVKAYVIDTGVRATHTEFAGRVAAGYTAVADGFGTDDCNGHGTHVAGTIGGTTYGVAKRVTIVPVRVLDCFGSGTLSGVIAGIDWVTANNNGALAVANMSLGASATATVDAAVERLVAAGVTVAVAAGNANVDACGTSPARTPSAITVGATDNTDARAVYSNFGPCVDIFAPGTNVTSSWADTDSATNTISGTSMATPHVAGAAALILAANPGMTPANVAAAMMAASTPNVVASAGVGSPNRFLYSAPPAGNVPPSIVTTTLPGGGTSTPYSASLGVAGGTAPYNWSLTAGSLPTGLTLAPATGVISGTPTTAGVSSFTVMVTDGKGLTASASLSINIILTIPVPGAFSKTSPTTGVTGRSRSNLVLTWAASTGATRYEYCLDTINDNLCNSSWVSTGTALSVTIKTLSSRTTYYWHVRAVNSGGITMSNNNTFWRFTTA